MGPPGPLGQGWALCVCVSFRPHPKTMSQHMVYQMSHTASHHTQMETRTRTHAHTKRYLCYCWRLYLLQRPLSSQQWC